jgi:hypothetical protein
MFLLYTLQQEQFVKEWLNNKKLRYLVAVPLKQLAENFDFLRREVGFTRDGT